MNYADLLIEGYVRNTIFARGLGNNRHPFAFSASRSSNRHSNANRGAVGAITEGEHVVVGPTGGGALRDAARPHATRDCLGAVV